MDSHRLVAAVVSELAASEPETDTDASAATGQGGDAVMGRAVGARAAHQARVQNRIKHRKYATLSDVYFSSVQFSFSSVQISSVQISSVLFSVQRACVFGLDCIGYWVLPSFFTHYIISW